jgi:hypothetical protein
MPCADEQRFQIVFAGLFDQAALQVYIVDPQFLLADQGGDIEAQSGLIVRQFLRRLFERDAYSGIAELPGSADQEFHAEQRLPAAGAAADQCGAPV